METKKNQQSVTDHGYGNTSSPAFRAKGATDDSALPGMYSFTITFTDPIPIKQLGTKFRGNFNHLRWSRPEQIGSRIKSLIEECFPEISVKLVAEFEAQDGQLGSGLVVEVENGNPSKIELIVFGFAKQIKSGQSSQEDLFDSDSEEYRDIVIKHANEFLSSHGSLSIGAPLSIQGGQLNLQLRGKFDPPASHLPEKHEPMKFAGTVDGFQKSERIVHLISAEGTRFKAQFDLQFFMTQVGAAAITDNLFEITLLPKENAKGRLIYQLADLRVAEEGLKS